MDIQFSRLEDLSAKLNTASDTISETLKRVEAKLAALRLGVEVWLSLEPLNTTPLTDSQGQLQETISTYLGYAKVNGTWHIAVKNDEGDVLGGDNKVWPIHQAPRDERIAALKRIPFLISAIEKKAEEELNEIQFALASVSVSTAPIVNTKPKP